MNREFTANEEYKGYYITLEISDDAEDPRSWDNLGTMVCAHRRYNLGDVQIGHGENTPYVDTPLGFKEWLYAQSKKGKVIYLPLYLYDHGGISISTASFMGRAPHAEWDSGLIGYIYVTREKVLRDWTNWKYITPKRAELVADTLRQEVRYYDAYIRGETYAYTIWTANPEEDLDADQIDEYIGHCSGYYDTTDAMLEAKSVVDYMVRKELKDGLQLVLPNMEGHLQEQVQIEREKLGGTADTRG